MNKALLYNFPQKLTPYKLDIEEDPAQIASGRKIIDCFLVDRYLPQSGNIVADLRSDIFCALILHDKLCLEIDDTLNLLNLFGASNFIKLLESKAFEVYDDESPVASAIINTQNTYKLTIGNFSSDSKIMYLEGVLKKLSELPTNDIKPSQIKCLLTLLVSNTVTPRVGFMGDLLFKETTYDIKNKNVSDVFDISSTDSEKINKNDLAKVLRLHHINKGLIEAQRIDADSIIIDNWAKKFIQAKLSPVMEKHASYTTSEIFKNTILSNKGIPDLNSLFMNKIINIEDIIRFRQDTDGMLFRKWLSEIDYNPQQILETLLNKKPPNTIGKVANHLRFIYPKVIGLIDPLSGFIASCIDSYIVQKIIKGWHPSLFLDDKFKFTIDKNIELSKKQKKVDEIQKINGNIGRNDPCPCGSGIKFKKCCGG